MFGIKKEINRALNRIGVASQMDAFLLCGNIKREIKLKLKKEGVKIRSVKYTKMTQTIEIRLSNLSYGQEIRSREREIIKRINETMGGEYIKKIRYRLF